MSSETKQIRSALFQLSFPFMGKIVCGLPLFATFFCVLWSVLFDFEKATATHCRVNNYLPSISAAIGGFTPQRYVWRTCIAFHAAPRLMIAWAYYNFHTSVHAGKHNELYKAGAALTSLCHVVEVTALVGLTYISSLDNHGLHETLFIVFMASSLVYMLLTILLFYWGRSRNGSFLTLEESRSFSWKQRLFLTNISIFLFSVYVFFRHNWYCEPGVYTVFAACEYFVIVTNIAYHGTAIIDFSPFSLAYVNSELLAGVKSKAT